MSLLVDIATQALDPGYAAAAARRSRIGAPPRRGRVAVAVTLAAAALLVVIAGVQAHRRAPSTARTRAQLVAEVNRETSAVAALERQAGALRGGITDLRNRVLAASGAGAALTRRLDREEVVAGTVPVRGPGLRVQLGDAPTGASSDSGNRVLDRDVQSVVNALWSAGAEGIAINGERLTAQTAIRQAGDAILVNFVPVASPYDVEAVGDPVAMETSFGASPAAARMRTLAQVYGLKFGYRRAAGLALPPAPTVRLRYAHALPARPAEGRR